MFSAWSMILPLAGPLEVFGHDPGVQKVTEAMMSSQHLHSGNRYLTRGVVNSLCCIRVRPCATNLAGDCVKHRSCFHHSFLSGLKILTQDPQCWRIALDRMGSPALEADGYSVFVSLSFFGTTPGAQWHKNELRSASGGWQATSGRPMQQRHGQVKYSYR